MSIETVYERFTSDLLARKSFDPGSFFREIGAGDEMYHRAILPGWTDNPGLATFKYFESAGRIFDIYGQLADHLGELSKIGPVLDFGSGWGRLTRCLVQKKKRDEIWVSDIYSEAIAWQAEKLGVVGVVSVSDPDRFALKKKFSLIFAGSVFTHLPHDLFQRWLQKLYSLLAPSGVMAFSVSDETWLQAGNLAGKSIGQEGAAYFHQSESASLDHEIYGAMYVREDYVANSVAKLDPSRKVGLRRYKGALYENQDLYVLAGAEIDLSLLELTITPLGGTTYASRDGDLFAIGGWGIDLNRGHQLISANLFVGNESLGIARPMAGYEDAKKHFPESPNPAVLWSFEFSRPSLETFLRIELESSSGSVMHVYADPSIASAIIPRT